jgi:hypothetical protein
MMLVDNILQLLHRGFYLLYHNCMTTIHIDTQYITISTKIRTDIEGRRMNHIRGHRLVS